MPEFQKYLLSRQLVPEKNVSFYAWWVSKFLAFSNTHGGLSRQLLVERFLDHLTKHEHITDCQLRQAQDTQGRDCHREEWFTSDQWNPEPPGG